MVAISVFLHFHVTLNCDLHINFQAEKICMPVQHKQMEDFATLSRCFSKSQGAWG